MSLEVEPETRERGAAAAERIVALDALRGFALFGILLANILYWSGWIFMSPAQQGALAGVDGAAAFTFWDKFLVDGKFYTLFSLLFGIGFSLQLTRLERRGADGVRIFRRRLLVLLGFGLIHLVMIWDGDILTLYALLGLTLPWFRAWSSRALLVAAVLLLLLPLPGAWLFKTLGWAPERVFMGLSEAIARRVGGMPGHELEWLQRRDAAGFFAWTISGWPYRIVTILESWRIPKVLGIMLLGVVLGRRLVAGTLLSDRRLFAVTLFIGALVGLPLSYVYAADKSAGQASVAAVLGTVPLALAYGAAFILLWPVGRAGLGVLAAPGRMVLTNYLLQSLLGIAIFYGIGLGLVGRTPPIGIVGIALAIFAGQIALSHAWLARFGQGPMERLWRRLTYGGPTARPSAGAVGQ